MVATAAKTIGARAAGRRASLPTAVLVSVAVGAVTTAMTYRWLRSGSDDAD
jgi:hypothetical protein